MNQWYYSQDGAQYGPVDEAEIVGLIQSGELPAGTPVCKEGGTDWQPAREHACLVGKKNATLKPIPKPAITGAPKKSNAYDDEKFYEQVAAELEGGKRRQGLWLKAETKAQGDTDKARWLYVGWRVEQLVEEEREFERQKKLKEEEREFERQKKLKEEEKREFERQKKLKEEEKREFERQKKLKEEELARGKAQRQMEEEAKLGAEIKTRKEADACIAPLTRFGYKLISSGTAGGKSCWRVDDPHLQSPADIPFAELGRYVQLQIAIYGFVVEDCPECGGPMEEVKKSVFKCPKC